MFLDCVLPVVYLVHLATTFLGQGYLSLPSHIDQLWACPQHYILGPSTKYILDPPQIKITFLQSINKPFECFPPFPHPHP
jgi:hypothetical protein